MPPKKRCAGSPTKSFKNPHTDRNKGLTDEDIASQLQLSDNDGYSSEEEFTEEPIDPGDAPAPRNHQGEADPDSEDDSENEPETDSESDEEYEPTEPTAAEEPDADGSASLSDAIEARLTRSASTSATVASTSATVEPSTPSSSEPPPTPSTSRQQDILADTPTTSR